MDEKDGICQVITASTLCKRPQIVPATKITHRSAAFKKIYTSMKERQEMIAASKPDDVRCAQCGRWFSAVWDHLEGRWEFPEISGTGICRQCCKLIHIRQNINTYLKNSGVPPKYRNCSFDNFHVMDENYKCATACKHYLSHHQAEFPGLYLFGNCGTGKTHMVSAITRELVLKGKQVVFTCVPRLCFEIKKAFDEEFKISEQDAIKTYTDCEYLVLDDLGVEKPTEWVRKTLSYVIYERDNMFKPTIITSNLSLDEIAGQVDQRTASRIAGMGRVMRVQGPDWRLK